LAEEKKIKRKRKNRAYFPPAPAEPGKVEHESKKMSPIPEIITDGLHLMTTARDINSLHKFARQINLKKEWYQDHPKHPHYYLTSDYSTVRAIRAGAMLVSTRDMIRMAKGKLPIGRPPEYKPEYAGYAKLLCSHVGYDREKLSQVFGIKKTLLDTWLRKYPDLKKAVMEGKDYYYGIQVEGALIKSALGHPLVEVTKERKPIIDENGKKTGQYEFVETKRVQKWVPPNPITLIFYLVNRLGERWRNIKYVDIKQFVDETKRIKIEMSHLDDRQIMALIGMAKGRPREAVKLIEGSIVSESKK